MHRDTWCLTITIVLCVTIMLMGSPTQAAQLQLAWGPSTTNTNGAPLEDLAGYKLHYGQTNGRYSSTVDVGNTTSYIVSDLTEGKTYYFVTTAYDLSGNESGFSNEVSRAIATPPSPETPHDAFRQDSRNDGLVVLEAENAQKNTLQGGHDWTLTTRSGFSGTAAMEVTPNTGTTRNTDYATNSPRLDFQVNFARTGTHYIWIRGLGPAGGDDSVHVGRNGQALATSDRMGSFPSIWTWSNHTMDGVKATFEVPTVGVPTENVWMREDGFVFDKLLLTTSANYIPHGTGPVESPRGHNPEPVAIGSFTVTSHTIVRGNTATLAWTTDATTVTISPSPGNGFPTAGSVTVNPATTTTSTLTSNLTATGQGGLRLKWRWERYLVAGILHQDRTADRNHGDDLDALEAPGPG